MIKNQRQYEATQVQVAAFQQALVELDPEDPRLHPLLRKAKRDALQGQIDQLRGELLDYELLQSGETSVLELTGLEDLPSALIRGRIAARLTQRELAERLSMKEQQIQRYEATDYAGASLERIRAIADALGLVVREEVYLPSADVSWRSLAAGLKRLGIDASWIDRILPGYLLAERESDEAQSLALR
jgi:transcriptional regulator with XRE-family HTH domain